MACTPAPTCQAALREASRLWPWRDRGADGICASAAHHQQNPTSDHETGDAFDLTDDKAGGCDADRLAELLRHARDPRVKYVISERRMFSSYAAHGVAAWTWRPYHGTNPHTHHVHVSIVAGARDDTAPWWGPLLAVKPTPAAPTPRPQPAPPAEEDDLTPEQDRMLRAVYHALIEGDLAAGVLPVRDAANRAAKGSEGRTDELPEGRSLLGRVADQLGVQ